MEKAAFPSVKVLTKKPVYLKTPSTARQMAVPAARHMPALRPSPSSLNSPIRSPIRHTTAVIISRRMRYPTPPKT